MFAGCSLLMHWYSCAAAPPLWPQGPDPTADRAFRPPYRVMLLGVGSCLFDTANV